MFGITRQVVMPNSSSHDGIFNPNLTTIKDLIWTASSKFGIYCLCEQRRFRRACASAPSHQNLRCLLIQAASQEEPSDRKPDPWPLWMAGHAQLKFAMTECSKTQIRLTGLIFCWQSHCLSTFLCVLHFLFTLFRIPWWPSVKKELSVGLHIWGFTWSITNCACLSSESSVKLTHPAGGTVVWILLSKSSYVVASWFFDRNSITILLIWIFSCITSMNGLYASLPFIR